MCVSEHIIVVDKNDNYIGLEEKDKCHLSHGKLHRAFNVCVFNSEEKLLLTKRSQRKMLWPGCWDGTIASHPRKYESYELSSKRRLQEEIGVVCKLKYLFKFEYHVPYNNIGSENEVCGTLIGTFNKQCIINKNEISEARWVTSDELATELNTSVMYYCPWMIIALYLLSTKNNSDGYNFHKWTKPKIKGSLESSLKHYFSDNEWRLIV